MISQYFICGGQTPDSVTDSRGIRSHLRCAAIRSTLVHQAGSRIEYAKFLSRSHDAVIRVYDATGNVIETHEHAGEFEEW